MAAYLGINRSPLTCFKRLVRCQSGTCLESHSIDAQSEPVMDFVSYGFADDQDAFYLDYASGLTTRTTNRETAEQEEKIGKNFPEG